MNVWFVRLIVFGCLWGGLLAWNGGKMFSFQLVICAAAFTIYFLLPIVNHPQWHYILLQGLLFILVFLDVHFMWIAALLLYVVMEAGFQLQIRPYRLFVGYSFILLGFICFLQSQWLIAFFIIILLFLLLARLLNQYICERKEQREVYEQLLSEYRTLKRMNIKNEQVARLEERTRIARDIHDSVGHKLTALLMQIEILSLQKKTTEYEEIKQLAIESLEETRMAVKALRHEEVAGIASVLQLIRKLESENHLLVRFTTKQGVLQVDLSNEQSIALYRAIQEGLTNVMKHSSSRDVIVTLSCSAIGDLEWMIANPIPQPTPFELGFGLMAMKERVEEQGGTLRVYQTNDRFIIEGSMSVKEKRA